MRKVLYKNSISGIIQLIASSVLTFVSITIFIKYLGSELYGLFAIISIIGNINVFTNLGLNTTLVKFISEQGKTNESDLDIVVTILITCTILIPITIIAGFFYKQILFNILNVPNEYFDIAKSLFFCLLIGNFFTFLGQTFISVLDSQQKIVLTNSLQFLYNTLYWGSMLILIIIGYSIDKIGIGILGAALTWFILLIFSYHKIWGKLELKGFQANFIRISKKQIKYGMQIYASGLISLLYEPLTKIFISKFFSITDVGFFDIILKLRNQLSGLIYKAYYPLYPLLAQTKDISKSRAIVHDLEQKVFFIMPPVFISVIFCTRSFINLWIGPDSDLIISGTVIIICSYLLGSFTVIPLYQYLISKKAYITILIQSTNVLINVIVFLLTYNKLGFYSIFIAYSCAIVASFFVCLYYQNKHLKSLIFDSVIQIMKLFVIFIICFFVGYLLNNLIKNNVVIIICIPLSLIIVTLLLYRLLSIFNYNDISRYVNNKSKIFIVFSKLLIKN